MPKSLTFGFILGLVLFNAAGPRAQMADLRWEVLAEDEKSLIDRIAADFYEESLRRAQAEAIESHTAQLYARAEPASRASFIEERRAAWEAMNEDQRASLHGAKRPLYRNLTEEQKAPFRRHALDQLGGAGALDSAALAEALRNDI